MIDTDKKIIALLPIKNEAWILNYTLEYLSSFCNQIIIGDQMSTDGSRDIYPNFPKVKVIDNTDKFHSNKIRWSLLNEARKIEGNNILVFLDADELISPAFFENIADEYKEGDILELPWINIWKNTSEFRSDRYWKKLTKDVIFFDDKKSNYTRDLVLNDHTRRTPSGENTKIIKVNQYPIIHTEFLYWDKTQIKQAWYRCNELIQGNSPRKINLKYQDTLPTVRYSTENIPESWVQKLNIPKLNYSIELDWRYTEILEWIDQYGIKKFEPLQIWHIDELKDIFIKQENRNPATMTYPTWMIKLNNIKNYIKNEILS